MFMRIGWGRVKPGQWDAYQAEYEALHEGRAIPGRIASYLVQDVAHADSGFVVTLWRDVADIEAYDKSDGRKAMMEGLEQFFTGQYSVQLCRVVHQEQCLPEAAE
jgi:heme-degrading monooxygenase HmoA